MKNFLLLLFLLSVSAAAGQQRRVVHQTFDLENISGLEFDLYDTYEVEPWAGVALLVEITVEMWEESASGQNDAPEAVFKHFLEKGRYRVEGVLHKGSTLTIKSKDKQRAVIRTAKGTCSEKVVVRLMIPDTFNKTGDHSWAASPRE